MYACQDDIEKVSSARADPTLMPAKAATPNPVPIMDRVFTRQVLPLYGGDLTKAKTSYQLVTAFRDAVAGEIRIPGCDIQANMQFVQVIVTCFSRLKFYIVTLVHGTLCSAIPMTLAVEVY